MTEIKRINWVDATKGFAMLLVMMGHTIVPKGIEVWLYTFHMPLFFFLSGYVFKTRDGESFLSFARRKVLSLVVPMLLFSIISILVNLVYYCAILHNKTMSNVLESILGLFVQQRLERFSGSFWFLACLFVSEIIFYFLYRLRSKRVLFSAILLLCSLAGWIWCTYMDFSLPWSLDLVPIALFFIGCGVLVKEMKFSVVGKKRLFLLLAFLCINIGTGALNYTIFGKQTDLYFSDIGSYFLFYISALAGIGFSVLLFQLFDFKRGITYIGCNSLIYYCMHGIVYAVPDVIVYNIFHFNMESPSLIASLGISAMYVIIACVILYFISKFINRYCPFMLGKFCPQKSKRKVTG